jgi:hypothetical protein
MKHSKSPMAKITNIRLMPEQERMIEAVCARSSVVSDKSKFIRLAVDWLLISDLSEVLAELHS